MSWFLYLIECVDDSVYTGITTDVAARFDEPRDRQGRALHALAQAARRARVVSVAQPVDRVEGRILGEAADGRAKARAGRRYPDAGVGLAGRAVRGRRRSSARGGRAACAYERRPATWRESIGRRGGISRGERAVEGRTRSDAREEGRGGRNASSGHPQRESAAGRNGDEEEKDGQTDERTGAGACTRRKRHKARKGGTTGKST